jgi:hypothetical protein
MVHSMAPTTVEQQLKYRDLLEAFIINHPVQFSWLKFPKWRYIVLAMAQTRALEGLATVKACSEKVWTEKMRPR